MISLLKKFKTVLIPFLLVAIYLAMVLFTPSNYYIVQNNQKKHLSVFQYWIVRDLTDEKLYSIEEMTP